MCRFVGLCVLGGWGGGVHMMKFEQVCDCVCAGVVVCAGCVFVCVCVHVMKLEQVYEMCVCVCVCKSE